MPQKPTLIIKAPILGYQGAAEDKLRASRSPPAFNPEAGRLEWSGGLGCVRSRV